MSSSITEVSQEVLTRRESGAISEQKLQEYREFLQVINEKFLNHRIVVNNTYCKWFESANLTRDHVRSFIQQFSVFSHLFLIAALKRMINASSLENYRKSKEILANEIGVIYRKTGQSIVGRAEGTNLSESDKDISGDPELVSTDGTVDGGIFRFSAGHFEWLIRIGEQLGLDGFRDMGKRRLGTKSTLFFCDELDRIYGSDDANFSEGASFAVENWAAAGFWKQLIRGLRHYKGKELPDLKLAFFTWHDKVEDNHAHHMQDELAEVFFHDDFDKERFLKGGLEILDGVAEFWDGLNKDFGPKFKK